VKLTPASSGQNPNRPICSRSAVETTKPPAYPFIFHQCQRAQRQKSTGNTTHMAQPTNAVSRFPSASVTANPRNRPPRVPAEPSLPVNRYVGKPSNSRKKKKYLRRKISGNPLPTKETLGSSGCRNRVGPPESGFTSIRAALSPAGLRFPDQD
jgi:hypothetical protein